MKRNGVLGHVERDNELRRYTSLAAALDMLVESRLTLLSPATWKDVNDTRFLKTYCSTLNLKSLCVACFTQKAETYHHWQVFAGSNEGVCVVLDKTALLRSLQGDPAYVWNDVKYLTLEKLRALKHVDAYDLPFMKRKGFGDEKEFRLLWQSETEQADVHHIPIQRTWIKRIVLNPWLVEGLFPSIKQALKSIPGCTRIKIIRTSLIDNSEWKLAAERVDDFGTLLGPPPRSLP